MLLDDHAAAELEPVERAEPREPAHGADEVSGTKVGFRLMQGADGRLCLRDARGEVEVVVTRCFPWSGPSGALSLRDEKGEERAFIADPRALDAHSRQVLNAALERASFVFDVVRVTAVEDDFELRTWQVETERGARRFQTPLDVWPRAVEGNALLLEDVHGDLYRIRDPGRLDERSRALLWAFED